MWLRLGTTRLMNSSPLNILHSSSSSPSQSRASVERSVYVLSSTEVVDRQGAGEQSSKLAAQAGHHALDELIATQHPAR
jgi:hypothetical protein